MDSVLKSLFKISKTTTTNKRKTKAVKATRRKPRSSIQLINYVTGNGIIDWLQKHPEEVDVKYQPFLFPLTYKSGREAFLERVQKKAENLKLSLKLLEPSDYGCDTILAMRENVDVIVNATAVDRVHGRLAKAEFLVKSTVISRLLSTYEDHHGCMYGPNWHYVPVCFMSHADVDSRKLAELNIAMFLGILAKYQEYQPDLGFIVSCTRTGACPTVTTYRPTNYMQIQEGVKWLDMLDSYTEELEISSNAHITGCSPWCTAVKMRALEQDNITLLTKSGVTPPVSHQAYLDWKCIDEYTGRALEDWVDNYTSSTGENMGVFKFAFRKPDTVYKFVHCTELEGIVYQATVLDVLTGDITYIFADNIHESNVLEDVKQLLYPANTEAWGWNIGTKLSVLNVSDMKVFCETCKIKFPYACNYDLDVICLRSLNEELQANIPVVNFNPVEVAREYYYGTSTSTEVKKQLRECMKKESMRVPMILQALLKNEC